MIADEFSKASKDRIFTVLNEIDLKVDRVKKKGIVFVGMSRVGKSTAYNWTIKHPLEAKIEEIVSPTSTRRRRRSSDDDDLPRCRSPQKSTTVTYVPKIIQTDTG